MDSTYSFRREGKLFSNERVTNFSRPSMGGNSNRSILAFMRSNGQRTAQPGTRESSYANVTLQFQNLSIKTQMKPASSQRGSMGFSKRCQSILKN
uniref:Uncharacterized protein n=1 Tax=Lotharella oceanica TaxID=641309 RepID=A0A7S2TZP8_9EUKA